ncbi:major facilitator superfamily domain-containing protein [Nemania abortiva]|nr:major facilitator superfamily domain-containing protein [Nemania abortiva]
MTDDNNMNDRNDGSPPASESSPLLQNTTNTTDANSPESASAHREDTAVDARNHAHKWRIVLLICAYAFAMMFADSLQPAALTKVFEDAICDSTPSPTPSSSPSPDRCKAPAVQKELALVRGFMQLAPIFSGILCTVPYGLLAERIGRKRVLMLSGVGTLAAFSWTLAVCYWRFLPVRWVLLSGVFLFVGGGDPVFSSTMHVMVTDATEQAERAQSFLYLHAADVVAGFFGPAISGVLMEKGHTWAVLLLSITVSVVSITAMALLIPETLHLRAGSSSLPGPAGDPTPSSSSQRSLSPVKAFTTSYRLIAPIVTVLTSNRQAMLLLCLLAPQTASRELFTLIGLQYSNAKFGLTYARGNLLLSLFQGTQGLVVLIALPLVTRLVANPRRWTPWTRDRLYAIVSILMMASGLVVIGVAPVLILEAIGLLFVALGGCSTGLLMSLLGGAVRPSQVSVVYSSGLMLSIIARSLIGPVASGLLVQGMELGWAWMGLPFVVIGLFMLGVGVTSLLIRKERTRI